jgi:tetratricopeptide (TPR) repeat protein
VPAATAYHRGDFAAAETSWRADLARDPTDWTTRYNLSVALAQQNRWDEAAAQAAAAFIQQPANASVRWQFALACDKAGFVPDALAEFLTPDGLPWLARLASPADWQRAGLVAATLGALALGLFLLRGYGLGPRTGMAAMGWTALALAIALGLAAGAGWRAYGVAANSEAAIIWRNGTLRSIPTETDSPQKTVPLAAGSVGIADKTFLGWVRLNFGNGQTGWVRKEEAIAIWK